MNQTSTLLNINSELIITKKSNSFKRFLQSSFLKLLLFICCAALQPAVAQWSSDPGVNTPVCTLPGDQNSPVMVSDGAGGAIMAWADTRNGNGYDIYAQRVNAAGVAQWQKNGIAIHIAAGNQYISGITSDGAGGAIITWVDQPGSNNNAFIGAQRVNAAGEVQWATNGIPVNTPGSLDALAAVSDGAGGAIITWSNYYGVLADSMRAQHINAAGIKQWGVNGILVSSKRFTFVLDINMISDDAGGAIITWDDLDNVYTQRINADGVSQWATNGILISAGQLNTSHSISTDGAGGAIITYEKDNSSTDIYAQRVNAVGVVQWANNGIAVCNAPNNQLAPNIIADAAGGAIIIWSDNRSGNYDVYAQRINSAGIIQWTVNGVAICTEKGTQLGYGLVSDGAGGAITTWTDDRNGSTTTDIYAQRINAAGVTQWTENGVAIDTALYYQLYPDMVSDGAAGAIIVMQDTRNSGSSDYSNDADIYAQNVKADGTLGCVIPAITTQPLAAQTVCLNTTLENLTVTATGEGLSYQWYADNDSLDFNGNAVNGETNTSFTPPTNTADTIYYYAIVINECGNSDTSNYAKVIVRALPVITSSSVDNGTVTPDGATTVNCGGTQTYTITPNTCYHITDVLVDGVSNTDAVSSGSYTFNDVQANHTISASFAINQSIITASSGANGTVTPSGATTVNCGGTQAYTITSNACYHIADVLVDGVSNADAVNSGSYTFNNVQANHTISATFETNSLPDAGTISGTSSICTGSSATFTDNISGGTWSSSNTSVAAVNASSGVVTGVAIGTANIKYTVAGSCGSQSATKDITVVKAPNAGTISCPFTVCVGSTTTFTSNGNSGGTWSSSNSAVAQINASTGMVTGVAAGIATIQYTVTNSCGSKHASKIIIVLPNTPIIICHLGGLFTRNAGASCNYVVSGTEFNPAVITVCNVPALTYSLSGATSGSGTSLAGVKLNKGTTIIKWKATVDTLSTTCSVIVNVRDVQPPSITCKPGATKIVTTSTYTVSGSEFDATASDNCGSNSLIYKLSGATVSPYSGTNTSLARKKLNIGTTNVTWKANDESNNTSSCTTVIKVKKSNSVSSLSIIAESDPEISRKQKLTVQAAPNPSTSHFTLLINSSGTDKIDMIVFDLSGRKIEQKLNVDPNSTIQLGSSYFPGVYMVELKQGEQTVHLKLIKAE